MTGVQTCALPIFAQCSSNQGHGDEYQSIAEIGCCVPDPQLAVFEVPHEGSDALGMFTSSSSRTAIGFVEGGENLDCGLSCRLGLSPFLMGFVRGVVSDCGMKPGLNAVGVQSMMSRPWGLFTGFFEFPQVAFCLEGVGVTCPI